MEKPFYTPPQSTLIMRLLWSAAGADRVILEKSTYSDQVKYMCLGGIIFATGVMAALAGGYAFYTIFSPRGSAIETDTSVIATILSIAFGLIWGLMIFNLDRFIVSSTGKGDGTEAITWGEFKGAIPRIIMGAIIALTISKPIEIRMFQTEINNKLYDKQLQLEKDFEKKTSANYEERLKVVENDLGEIGKQRQDLINRIKTAEQAYTDNLMGKAKGVNAGNGPLSKALKEQIDVLNNQLKSFDQTNLTKIDIANKKRKEILEDKEKTLATNKTVAKGLDGLLERIKLAHEIAGFWISLFITLLFMAIELTPIFFKLMLVKSPYDFMKDNIEDRIKAENGIFVEYNYHKDKKGQERDLVIFLDSEKLSLEKREIQKAQQELTEYAINKYKEDMKTKIDENPSAFIKVQDNK
jgi:hypothetical protein